jgi:hypothetical protein
MSSLETPLERLMFIWLVLTWVVMIGHWLLFGRKMRIGEEDSLGVLHNLEVTIMIDEKGRRLVGLSVYSYDEPTMYALLTPTEAKRLAGWLRLAAAPGRTLAEARRRIPKAPA